MFMASIDTLKASDGTGNASVATVQSVRSPGATTLVVDTVQGINTKFHATMGTPHTFVDPVTSETITVISEASAVDFVGHVDGSNLEIDTIAPGFTDAGSAVNDIVIVKPTTQWADEVANVLEVSLENDGTLQTDAVLDALGLNSPLDGWNPGLPAPNTITYNGNRSYDLVFNSTDLTDTLSPGMRLRTSRTVTAPTQCTSLNGTTQYWVKTSPNKLTFTDDFVVSAWIKVSSYAQGAIVSRFNGTSGWELRLEATGQVFFVGFNAGGTNFSYVQSYQSVPLNKWVHVTAQLDMSSFTATTTTSYVMLDGKDVPCVVARGGTNPTALVQAGNLEIGSRNGGTLLFPGKIAQVAIYNAKVTQANIVATISQGLSGSETSLASAYSFNNSTADLNTSTPNDLVAGAGSPTATNADSPFALGNDLASAYTKGTTDFGVVMATSFSTNTTVTVQVPEGCTIPTSGGVTSVVYSGQRSPYGFPSNRNLWTVECINKYQVIQSSPTAWTWYYTNLMLTTPIGAWKLGYELLSYGGKAASVFDHYVTLATSSATETSNAYTSVVTGYDTISSMQSRTGAVSLSSATPYYVNMKTSSSGVNNIQIVGIASYATGRIYAENAYV